MSNAIITTDVSTAWPEKLAALRAWLIEREHVLVAVSGGIDSTFLWKVAVDLLGDRALGMTAISPSLASWERDALDTLVREVGGRHRTVETHELDDPSYAANPSNRCFYCKSALWTSLTAVARDERIACVLDGYNLDDVGDHRPGQAAGVAHGIQSPLKQLGFRKRDIRDAAKALGMSIWAKPAMACLSSRFAYGVRITPDGLAAVDALERWVRERGFAQLRVRVHEGKLVRLELPVSDFASFMPHREPFVALCKTHGFLYVSLDLAGFRSGSMNAVLAHSATTPHGTE